MGTTASPSPGRVHQVRRAGKVLKWAMFMLYAWKSSSSQMYTDSMSKPLNYYPSYPFVPGMLLSLAPSSLTGVLPSPAPHSRPSPAIAETPVMGRAGNQACTNILHTKRYGNPGYSAVTGLPNCIIHWHAPPLPEWGRGRHVSGMRDMSEKPTPHWTTVQQGSTNSGTKSVVQNAGTSGSTSNVCPTPLNTLSNQPSTGVQRSPNGIGRGPLAFQLMSNGITVGQGGRLFLT
ncbi:hypothetical protein FA13DRAFT_1894296 [Coprinellus micaceus]|uniref:Uncharacterized protein n=1 Tax=Coprinellus micaceus TaxID=71717 RepID=A0A4Y7SWK7_COPMI|nr:hypothetical protein FA13DRAFT_1894296 [Coprinellus micaceus]